MIADGPWAGDIVEVDEVICENELSFRSDITSHIKDLQRHSRKNVYPYNRKS